MRLFSSLSPILSLFLALLLGRPALADEGPATGESVQPAKPVSIAGWTVSDYNDYVVIQGLGPLRYVRAQSATLQIVGSESGGQHLDGLRSVLDDGIRDLTALPPWRGDATLRDGLIAGFHEARTMLDTEVATIWATIGMSAPSNADRLRVEKLWTDMEQHGERIDLDFIKVQQAFAGRHNMVLVQQDLELPEPPMFRAPGIPPEGSPLPSNVYMTMLVGYSNSLIEAGNALIGALNACLALNPETQSNELSACAIDASATVKRQGEAIAARDADWDGNPQLMDDVRAMAAAAAQVTVHLEEYAALWATKKRKQKQINRINEIAGLLNTDLQAGVTRFNAGIQQWYATHHLMEYSAFVTGHTPAAEPAPAAEPPEETAAP